MTVIIRYFHRGDEIPLKSIKGWRNFKFVYFSSVTILYVSKLNMAATVYLLGLLALLSVVTAIPTATPTSAPQPAYTRNPPEGAASNYIPHVTYPYADGYGPISPYEGYAYPAPSYPVQASYMSSLIPAAQGALQLALRVFAKVGLFLFGGVALLVVGGLFTTAVCSLTPICTITFDGFGGIDKETVRSLMTPEKISTAAALVQDAIGKYQRMQRN